MEDLCSMWNYQESIDELKQKSIFMTLELEQARKQANEDMRKNKEHINYLLGLLKIAYQERDEARDQIQKLLLNKVIPQTQPESSLVIPGKANSSVTESNSLSETYNHYSHGSSPIDSFLEPVTSPDISSIILTDSTNTSFGDQPLVQDYNGLMLGNSVNGSVPGSLVFSEKPKIDPISAIIDDLAMGRSLPQKGRLLQTMLESGPLLKTLFVSGSLPTWRNPPTRSFRIPPVPIKGPENVTVNEKPSAEQVHWKRKQENSSAACYDISRASPQACSASMLNLAAGYSASYRSNDNLLTPGNGLSNQIPDNKRQRFQ